MPYRDSPGATHGIRKAVVPAAGLGTRLRPLTNAFPKELLPIGRKPVLGHVASELIAAGITEALFIVSDQKPQIRGFIGDLYRDEIGELHCSYAVQSEQRGLGDALLCAESWVDADTFVVSFGDCIIEAEDAAPLRRIMAVHLSHASNATVLSESVLLQRVSRYGVLAPVGDMASGEPFEVADVVEKPSPENAPSTMVVAARWVLEPSVFGALKRAPLDSRRELGLTEAVRDLRRAGGAVWAAPLHTGEARRDIGNFETFYEAFILAAMRDEEYGDSARAIASRELAATR